MIRNRDRAVSDPVTGRDSPASIRLAIIAVSRVAHSACATVLLGCIVIVWSAALSGQVGPTTVVAIGLLGAEGILVLRAGGRCPLDGLWRRLGDDTPLFELCLGQKLAPYTVPFLGVVTALGSLGVIARVLTRLSTARPDRVSVEPSGHHDDVTETQGRDIGAMRSPKIWLSVVRQVERALAIAGRPRRR